MALADRLQEFPIFKGFKAEDLQMLASLMEEVVFQDKENIVSNKMETTHLYFLLDGRAKIYKVVEGQISTLTILEKDDVFGEVSFIDQMVRSASVNALGDCTVAILKIEHLEIIKRQAPAFGMDLLLALMKELTRKFRSVSEGLDIKSSEFAIQELIASGQTVKVTTKSGLEYLCTIKASDPSQVQPMLKIGLPSGQMLIIPFHEVKALIFPNKNGTY